jgi:hypothetical protein
VAAGLQPAPAQQAVWSAGNVFTAMALLLGVAAEELKRAELEENDVSHPVMTFGRFAR